MSLSCRQWFVFCYTLTESRMIRHCEEIRWTKMTQDFSAMTTKSAPKKTSQIVQIIFEQCLSISQPAVLLQDLFDNAINSLTRIQYRHLARVG